jgi:hypothetical protein
MHVSEDVCFQTCRMAHFDLRDVCGVGCCFIECVKLGRALLRLACITGSCCNVERHDVENIVMVDD